MIKELLQYGRAAAVSAENLMIATGLKDRRELYERIETERKAGAVILSNKESGGYYLPETRQELQEFITTAEKTIRTTARTLESARELLQKWETAETGL